MPYYIHKYLPSENQDMIHGERIVETQSQLQLEIILEIIGPEPAIPPTAEFGNTIKNLKSI